MTQRTLGIIFVVVAFATSLYIMRTSSGAASMLLLNGTIYTLDGNNSVAQAIALNGNRILATGTTEEITRRYKSDNVIDLQGKTVLPGLIDGHGHVLGEGSALHNLNLVGTNAAEEVIEIVRKRVGSVQPGVWISGRGWDQNDWQVEKFPEASLLDRIAPDNPVYLTRIDGHAIWVNTKAMDLAGVIAQTPDPVGGKIIRDAGGKPTGVFVDNAMDLIARAVPQLTDTDVEERLKLALNECAKLGITEVHDMGVDVQTIRTYKKLIDNGECPVRVYAAIGGPRETGNRYVESGEQIPAETWNTYLKLGREIGYGNGMLTVRAVKLYADGALGSRGAALLDSYSDDPGNRGLTVTTEADLEIICRQAEENGFQVCVHAIGDRGNDIVLNVYEKVLQSHDKAAPLRWRIEHAQVLAPSDIPRFARLGIIPSMQPTHATSDMYWAEARLGAERVKGAYAWRSLMQNGSIIVGGSDFPVEGVNPLWGIYAAITRSDKSGYPQDGWYPEQKMTREEAARAFSQWAAYGAFEENMKGTLEPGKWADITILSKDIMTVPPRDILTTEVEMTIVGGNIVYKKLPIAQ
ncbi:MAG TPA: amidohydrolase [Bacteroidota bacterium]|nr:amidohydrolase [Bacteroidota bacterium]